MKVNTKLLFKTFYFSFFKTRGTPGRLTPKRIFFLIFLIFFYPIWFINLNVASLLDNLFFKNYKKVKIKSPIFIIGNFRSGTTFLHRLLIKDKEAACLRSWEIYLAPSIIGRKLLQGIMKIDYAVGNPMHKVINAFERMMAEYSTMHKVGVNEPEEDGQVLLHIWSSYYLLAFFPFPKLFRNYIYYDLKVAPGQRKRDMRYYHKTLKKHIYVHGKSRYISKNPCYSAKVRSLLEEFPDARFINLVRDPLEVVPSTISLYANHWQTYGNPLRKYPLQKEIIEHCKFWYDYPHRYLKTIPKNQYIRVDYKKLTRDPKGTIERIYKRFGFEMDDDYAHILDEEAQKAKQFKSRHKYSLEEIGLDKDELIREFEDVHTL